MSHAHEPPEPPALYAVPPSDDDSFDTRPPPHDADAERWVLSAVLNDPKGHALIEALGILSSGDFYLPRHELIFGAAASLHANGEPVDFVTVQNQLTTTKDLSRAGGGPYVYELYTLHANDAATSYYARIVADHAGRRAILTAGNRLAQLGRTDSGTLTDLQQEAATTVARATTHGARIGLGSTWQPLPLEKYLYGDGLDSIPPATLARTDGPCLLYAGAVHSISGEPESGKSWVALIAAAQEIAKGKPVVYLDFEDRPARVIGRLLELGAHPAQVEAHFRYIRPEVALSPATAPHLMVAAEGSTLAVIDGITEAMTLHGLSLLDNEDVARWLTLLPRRLADTGPAVLQIDHVIKNPEARGRYAIGGQHKLAGIDGCAYKIAVTEPFGRGKRGHARLTLDKDREGHVRALALGLTVATLTIDSRPTERHNGSRVRAYLDPPTTDVGPDGAFRPTGLMERVSRYVELNPGSTQNTIEDTVRGNGKHLRDAVRALISEGYFRTAPGARNSVLHYCDAPFREDEE
jgi:hypothetical protein